MLEEECCTEAACDTGMVLNTHSLKQPAWGKFLESPRQLNHSLTLRTKGETAQQLNNNNNTRLKLLRKTAGFDTYASFFPPRDGRHTTQDRTGIVRTSAFFRNVTPARPPANPPTHPPTLQGGLLTSVLRITTRPRWRSLPHPTTWR